MRWQGKELWGFINSFWEHYQNKRYFSRLQNGSGLIGPLDIKEQQSRCIKTAYRNPIENPEFSGVDRSSIGK